LKQTVSFAYQEAEVQTGGKWLKYTL
jgi:hypothetical protein